MSILTATLAGARSPTRPLRIVVALLAVLQLSAPLAALAADEAPAASHVDHIGAPGDGCVTLHDEHFCLSCRVLTATPLHGPVPVLPPQPGLSMCVLVESVAGHSTSDPATTRLARAPPRA